MFAECLTRLRSRWTSNEVAINVEDLGATRLLVYSLASVHADDGESGLTDW